MAAKLTAETHHNLVYFLILNLHLECSLLQLELFLFRLYL